MGKAARNEARKLTALYLNNIAVALLVAGVAIPLLAFLRTTPADLWEWLKSLYDLGFPRALTKATDVLIEFLLIYSSIQTHFAARRLVGKIED